MSNRTQSILFLSHLGGMNGGAERSLLAIVRYLAQKGYRPIVIVPEEGVLYEALRQVGCTVYIVPFNWWTQTSMLSDQELTGIKLHNATALRRIQDIIAAEKPVVSITNTLVAPWLAYASALTNTPHAWFLREFGVADHNLQFMLSESAVFRTVATLSSKIFVNSKAMQLHFAQALDLDPDTIAISYPYVQLASSGAAPDPFIADTQLKIIAVGQIKPSKGQFDAVKAVKLLRDSHGIRAQLCLVGIEEDTAYVAEIRAYIAKHALADAVIFLGFAPNPQAIMQYASLAVVCSRNEAFGRVVVEAMLAKLPVIGHRSAGIQEIIDDGKTGLLYDTPKDLAAAARLLATDPKKAAALERAAFTKASKTYSLENVMRPILQFVQQSSVTQLDLSLMEGVFALHAQQEQTIQYITQERADAQQQLQAILQSRKWQLIGKVAKVAHRFKR